MACAITCPGIMPFQNGAAHLGSMVFIRSENAGRTKSQNPDYRPLRGGSGGLEIGLTTSHFAFTNKVYSQVSSNLYINPRSLQVESSALPGASCTKAQWAWNDGVDVFRTHITRLE